MTAVEHTHAMLRWWAEAGVDVADLAVRREDGTMLWHRGVPVPRLPLPWARAENVRRADVYVRPARACAWSVLLLDDVPVAVARRIAGKYAALAVRTSQLGGCHVWLRTASPLAEAERAVAQRWLADRAGADARSTSGEHLGRLAGLKNWKRGGEWINVLASSHRAPWPATEVWTQADARAPLPRTDRTAYGDRPNTVDDSESGKEWGWVAGSLESGLDPDQVYARLVERARLRRGVDAERYARLTVSRAQRRRRVEA